MKITEEIAIQEKIKEIAGEYKFHCDYSYNLKQWLEIIYELIHRYGEDAELEFGATTYSDYGDEYGIENWVLYKTRAKTTEEIKKEIDDDRAALEKEQTINALHKKYPHLEGKYGTHNLHKMHLDGLLPL